LALLHDAPWEGTGCGYHSVFQDENQYRMYYKAWHLDVSTRGLETGRHPLYCCYAHSDDGVHWQKPNLGLHAFAGSKQNNIVLASGKQPPRRMRATRRSCVRRVPTDCYHSSRRTACIGHP
jgi:hypothetical protein